MSNLAGWLQQALFHRPGDWRRKRRRIEIAACAIGVCFALAMGPAVVSRLMSAGNPAYLDLHLSWKVLGVVALIGWGERKRKVQWLIGYQCTNPLIPLGVGNAALCCRTPAKRRMDD